MYDLRFIIYDLRKEDWGDRMFSLKKGDRNFREVRGNFRGLFGCES